MALEWWFKYYNTRDIQGKGMFIWSFWLNLNFVLFSILK
jgi:hypothetical protein